jgi:hypothetical protein
MKTKKTLTAAKLAAQRDNAQGSTGPKSIVGKRNSSRNSTSHGVFVCDRLLPGESAEEWEQLKREMIEDRNPIGSRELRRVEKITWNEWRLRRLRRAENGEIAKLLADHEPAADIVACTHIPAYNKAVKAMQKLELVEQEINSQGRIGEENQAWLHRLPYEAAKNLLTAIEITEGAEGVEGACASPESPAASEGAQSASATNAESSETVSDLTRQLLLNVLSTLNDQIIEERVFHGQYLIRRAQAQGDALFVPQTAVLDRLLRYETHILRNIDRDENALERMQRLRQGEKVPPPPAL